MFSYTAAKSTRLLDPTGEALPAAGICVFGGCEAAAAAGATVARIALQWCIQAAVQMTSDKVTKKNEYLAYNQARDDTDTRVQPNKRLSLPGLNYCNDTKYEMEKVKKLAAFNYVS